MKFRRCVRVTRVRGQATPMQIQPVCSLMALQLQLTVNAFWANKFDACTKRVPAMFKAFQGAEVTYQEGQGSPDGQVVPGEGELP